MPTKAKTTAVHFDDLSGVLDDVRAYHEESPTLHSPDVVKIDPAKQIYSLTWLQPFGLDEPSCRQSVTIWVGADNKMIVMGNSMSHVRKEFVLLANKPTGINNWLVTELTLRDLTERINFELRRFFDDTQFFKIPAGIYADTANSLAYQTV